MQFYIYFGEIWNFTSHFVACTRRERGRRYQRSPKQAKYKIKNSSMNPIRESFASFYYILFFVDFENEFISELCCFLLLLSLKCRSVVVGWFFDADYFTFATIGIGKGNERGECDFSLIAFKEISSLEKKK